MQHAVVVHAPAVGGTLAASGRSRAASRPAVQLTNAAGVVDAVAVVAATTWDAMQGVEDLDLTWHAPADAASADLGRRSARRRRTLLERPVRPVVAESAGDARGAIAARSADASTSPTTCPISPMRRWSRSPAPRASRPARCELWAPTQAPGLAAQTAAAICGIDPDHVTVHTTLLGGGLGRKFENDFVAQAVQIAEGGQGRR